MANSHGLFQPAPILKEKAYPHLPSLIPLDCVDADGFFLPNDNIVTIELRGIKGESSRQFAVYLKPLGQGRYSTVHLMQDKLSGEISILKLINPSDLNISEKQHLPTLVKNETGILIALKELIAPPQFSKQFGLQVIGIKYHHGISLDALIQQKPHLPDSHWLQIAKNIVDAVVEFFKRGYLHCDLKPENIIINRVTYDIALIDHQFTQRITPENPDCTLPHLYGSFIYQAGELKYPDVCPLTYLYNEKTLVYALGMTLAELFHALNDDFTLYAKNSAEFKQKCCLSDEVTRNIVGEYLRVMTNIIIATRATLEKTARFYNSMCFKLKDAITAQRKIGIFDVDEYLLADDDKKLQMQLVLQLMNEVWVIDRINRNTKFYFELSHRLKNVPIGNRLFAPTATTSTAEVLIQLSTNAETQPSSSDLHQHYFYVTATQPAPDLTLSLAKNGILPLPAIPGKTPQAYQDDMSQYLHKYQPPKYPAQKLGSLLHASQ